MYWDTAQDDMTNGNRVYLTDVMKTRGEARIAAQLQGQKAKQKLIWIGR